MFIRILLLIFLFFLTPGSVNAHSGGTAADGCHRCLVEGCGPIGSRHCHGGGTNNQGTGGSSGGQDGSWTFTAPGYHAPTLFFDPIPSTDANTGDRSNAPGDDIFSRGETNTPVISTPTVPPNNDGDIVLSPGSGDQEEAENTIFENSLE